MKWVHSKFGHAVNVAKAAAIIPRQQKESVDVVAVFDSLDYGYIDSDDGDFVGKFDRAEYVLASFENTTDAQKYIASLVKELN